MKIGLIGGYGHNIVRHFPGAELAWACDGYDKAALKKADALNITDTYERPAEMLEKFQPDLVYIGSAYARNGHLAVAMRERGLPVVAEKPLAADWKTFARLKELTDGGRHGLVAEFTMRGNPAFARAHELIHSGRIGEPMLIQAQKTYKFGAARPAFYKDRSLSGGIIPWVAIHAVDYAMWCSGLRYQSVTAAHGNHCHPDYPGMEDHSSMLFRMTNGASCVITADFLRPAGAETHGDDRLRVTGSKGVVEVRGNLVICEDGDGVSRWEESEGAQPAKVAQAMVDAAIEGKSAPYSTAEAFHATAAALAARDSADHSGNSVEVPQDP